MGVNETLRSIACFESKFFTFCLALESPRFGEERKCRMSEINFNFSPAVLVICGNETSGMHVLHLLASASIKTGTEDLNFAHEHRQKHRPRCMVLRRKKSMNKFRWAWEKVRRHLVGQIQFPYVRYVITKSPSRSLFYISSHICSLFQIASSIYWPFRELSPHVSPRIDRKDFYQKQELTKYTAIARSGTRRSQVNWFYRQ